MHELGLTPVDVPMDPGSLRAHPSASPFDWDVGAKRHVVATWAPVNGFGGLSLILNGHIDVVSPEPRSQWDRHPSRRTSTAIGCRGGAPPTRSVGWPRSWARSAACALGLTPRAPIHIQSVVEEECTGNGTLQTVLAGYAADAAIIAEPFGAAITTSQVGVLWFDVIVEGLPGHAAESGSMVSAIESSLVLIQALRALEAELNAAPPPPPYDGYPHPISLNVGQISRSRERRRSATGASPPRAMACRRITCS
jgi:acetylornithine deacetylase